MFGRSWRVGSVGGIPVNVDSSWIWIAILVTYSLWTRFDATYVGVDTIPALVYAVVAAVLFFGSVFLHELAHAVAARLNDIEVYGITLVIFGGFTSARSDRKGPGASFVMSAVGPATSLALGGVYWFLSTTTDGPLAGAFGYVGWVNLFMAVFNVLPGLPLDGGRMLEAAVWRVTRDHEKGTRVAARAGMVVGALAIGAGVLELTRDDPGAGFWLGLIGLFIFQGARSSEQQIGVRRRLAAGTVADAMEPPPPPIPGEMPLSEALERYLRGHEAETFPVVDDGRVIGMLTFESARGVGMHDPFRPARDAVIPLTQVVTTSPAERLDDLAARLGTGRSALVLRDGRLVGTITGGAVVRWVSAR